MPIELKFKKKLDLSHPVHLVFGDESSSDPDNLLRADIVLPAPTVAMELSEATALTANIALPLPMASMVLEYDNAVNRSVTASVGAGWQQGTKLPKGTNATYRHATPLPAKTELVYEHGQHLQGRAPTTWDQATGLDRAVTVVHERGTHVGSSPRRSVWEEGTRRAPYANAPWQRGTHRPSTPRYSAWQEMGRNSRPVWGTAWQLGHAVVQSLSAPAVEGKRLPADWLIPWERGRQPDPGRSATTPPRPPIHEPCYVPPPGDAVLLVFKRKLDHSTYLVLPCCQEEETEGPPALVIVPIKRFYMITNNVVLRRVEGNIVLPTLGLSLSVDAESWTWSFSASVPGGSLADLQPNTDGDEIEMEARFNGVPYRLLLEGITRDREFGVSVLRLSGRGKSALLDKPYAPDKTFTNTEARTAQQLMDDVLTDNGVSLGWSVDWGVLDWEVPAGAFAHQGSYISALNSIAASAGGYTQPHATANTIKVLPRYPMAPWAWGGVTPDFELPAAVAVTEGIEWVRKPSYNRVFVSGTGQGYFGPVTRTGTAGDLLAPMVTDALATDPIMLAQRGLQVLADTGRQAQVTLRLPVLEETGIIVPGKFVRYLDGAVTRMGIVRSVNVTDAAPELWQQIQVETHVN